MAQWWSWQSREVLLIILVFMVVLALWNTTEKMTMGKMWSKTRYTPQPVGVARDTDNYTLQIATYLEGRRKGLTQDQIATDIFKVRKGCQNRLVQGLYETTSLSSSVHHHKNHVYLNCHICAALWLYARHFPALLMANYIAGGFPQPWRMSPLLPFCYGRYFQGICGRRLWQCGALPVSKQKLLFSSKIIFTFSGQ